MAVQVLGKVAYFNKGAYNSETNYEINDVVSYNGSSYVSLNDNNQGNLPTNTNYWSVVAEKGDKGDTGKPFVIEKTYSTVESMVADYDNMNVNDYVMIQGSVEEQENATLWTKREVEVAPYKWAYLADFSGASGITGATPNIHIGNVTEGNEPSVTRRSGSSDENPILDFVLKTGAKGDTGATGNGISSIEKTSTSGLVDTYTITFTNGTNTTIEVTNGRSIVSIAKTGTVDYVDTYTITYNDGTTSTFEVANSEVTEEEFDDVVDELSYLYDDLPKVEGEGTNLALNNTRKGKMSNVLRGNTSQYTTTGKNLLQITATSQTKNSVNFTINENKTVLTSGTANSTSTLSLGSVSLEANSTYTLSGCPANGGSGKFMLRVYGENGPFIGSDEGDGATFTPTESGTYDVRILYYYNWNLTNLLFKPMIEKSSSVTDFEPYTNGASPNPNYPQDVHVVSGNNTIEICGKNLFDGVFRQDNQHNNWNTARIFSNKNDWKVNVGDKFTFSTNLDLTTFDYAFYIMQYPYLSVSSNTVLYVSNYQTTNTFTINCEYEGYFGFTVRNKNESNITPSDVSNYWFQIEKGSTATSYEPYQSASYPINLGVRNLWNNQSTGFLSQSGAYPTTNSSYPSARYVLIPLITGQSITLSGSTSANGRVRYIDKSTNQVVGTISQETNAYYTSTAHFTTQFNNGTITANKEFIVGIMDMSGNVNDLVVNYGTRPSTISDTPIELCKIGDYQDYLFKDNGKWYKHSEIGKVVLDGSEDWTLHNSNASRNVYKITKSDILPYNNNDEIPKILLNYFTPISNASTFIPGTASMGATKLLYLIVEPTYTLETFEAWLSTHNTIVYYVLETPTNTEITDQTLIAQLDNFEKAISYNTQTNISQENNDLPFIISVSAFMSLKYLFGNLETRVAELEESEPSEL